MFDFIFDAEQEYAIIAVETAVAGISILSLLGAGNIICCQKNNNDKETKKKLNIIKQFPSLLGNTD